jgi:hypothetical protein
MAVSLRLFAVDFITLILKNVITSHIAQAHSLAMP